MRRGLDHVVHLVKDLDVAGEVYDLLGFTVGPRNLHPWGTSNRIVQTPGFFIELLEVSEPEKIPAPEDGIFSFGAFNRDFLARNGEGLSMLVLEGSDPAGDKQVFDADGFGGFDVFNFSRMARRPDGAELEVGFSLAFAMDPGAPDAGFFTCMQRMPGNFWSPPLQRHTNGATGIRGVVLVADVPTRHAAIIESIAGVPLLRASESWWIASTPRGDIDLMTRELFHERFGVAAPGAEGLRIAALRFWTPGVEALRRSLAARRMLEDAIAGVVVVRPGSAMGATFVFEQA